MQIVHWLNQLSMKQLNQLSSVGALVPLHATLVSICCCVACASHAASVEYLQDSHVQFMLCMETRSSMWIDHGGLPNSTSTSLTSSLKFIKSGYVTSYQSSVPRQFFFVVVLYGYWWSLIFTKIGKYFFLSYWSVSPVTFMNLS